MHLTGYLHKSFQKASGPASPGACFHIGLEIPENDADDACG